MQFSDSEADSDVRIDFPDMKAAFPLSVDHVNKVRTVAKKLASETDG